MEGEGRRSSPPKPKGGGVGKHRHGGGGKKDRSRSGGGDGSCGGGFHGDGGVSAYLEAVGLGGQLEGAGGFSGAVALPKEARGGSTVVYSKSPAKSAVRGKAVGGEGSTVFQFGTMGGSSGSIDGGGIVAAPGTVKNLMARFNAGVVEDGGAVSWAATVEAEEARAAACTGDGSDDGMGRMSNVDCIVGEGSNLMQVNEKPLNMMNLQSGGKKMASTGDVFHLSETCTQGVRSFASSIPDAHFWKETEDGAGHYGDKGSGGGFHGGRDMNMQVDGKSNPACNVDNSGLLKCPPDVCRYGPTVADVDFSLKHAGLGNHNDHSFGSHTPMAPRLSPSNIIAPNGPGFAPNMQNSFGPNPGGHGEPQAGNQPKAGSAWQRRPPIRLTPFSKADVSSDGITVDLDPVDTSRNVERLEKAIICSLMGRRFPYVFLSGELARRWGQFGEFKLIMTGADCFICVFASSEARDAVLMGGPWFIAGQVIGMDKWSEDIDPYSLKGLSAPVWVRLPKLPLSCWDNRSIARIAAMIGEPLWVDAQTDSWDRGGYARVCVKLDLAQKLVTGVTVNGRKGRFFQPVEYEGISFVCFSCGRIGHKDTQCPMVGVETSDHTPGGSMVPPPPPPAVSDVPAPSSGETGEKVAADHVRPATAVPSPHTPKDKDGLGPWILVQRRKNLNKGKGAGPSPTPNVHLKNNDAKTAKANTRLTGRRGAEISTTSASGSGFNVKHVVEGSPTSVAADPCPSSAPCEMVDRSLDTAVDPSTAMVLHMPPASGIRERSVQAAMGKELVRLGMPPKLPKKRRKNSVELADGGDASPSVDQ